MLAPPVPARGEAGIGGGYAKTSCSTNYPIDFMTIN